MSAIVATFSRLSSVLAPPAAALPFRKIEVIWTVPRAASRYTALSKESVAYAR